MISYSNSCGTEILPDGNFKTIAKYREPVIVKYQGHTITTKYISGSYYPLVDGRYLFYHDIDAIKKNNS